MSRSHKGHYSTRHTALWTCTHIPNIIDLSRKTKMLWPRQENNYYLKNNYLTLRSTVKVPQRSLRYATHRLMVMHPHTKLILFKKQLFDLEVNGQGPTKVITVHDTPPYGHAPTYEISVTYLERQNKLWSGQASLRRSGRKNQTKTICLPSFEGET